MIVESLCAAAGLVAGVALECARRRIAGRPAVLTTAAEIGDALEACRPGLTAAIHARVARRGHDPAALTPDDYRALVMEEADFALEVAHGGPAGRAGNLQHVAALREIAAAIRTGGRPPSWWRRAYRAWREASYPHYDVGHGRGCRCDDCERERYGDRQI